MILLEEYSAKGIIGLRLNTSAASLVNGDYVQILNNAACEIGTKRT